MFFTPFLFLNRQNTFIDACITKKLVYCCKEYKSGYN